MEQEHSKSTINNMNIKDSDSDFQEESHFSDADDSPESDHSRGMPNSSSISDLDNISVTSSIQSKQTMESPSCSLSPDRNYRQLVSEQNPKEIAPLNAFSNITDSFVGFDPHDSTTSLENDSKISTNLKDNKKPKSKLYYSRFHSSLSSLPILPNEENNDNSAITSLNDDETINATDSPVSGSNFLFSIAGLVIKMTGFQLNLFISSVTLPIWLTYYSYMFMINPFASIRLAKRYTLEKFSSILSMCTNSIRSILYKWIRKHDSLWNLCFRIGWGLLWSVYVGFILTNLLIFALIMGGIILKCIIEEPVQITQELSFDYTKDSPTAFVPLMSCPESSFLECSGPIRPEFSDESRVIPLNHKVHVTVSLILPESYYNRNLGIFQVRVDFLANDGKTLASTRQPCMLQFKSQPIRLILTFVNLAPLVTGYSSETQTLNIKFREYTEKTDPTSCVRVILEQRAEFEKRAGIPEIYEAFLKIDSQQPFLKRILWYWKGTVYIWATAMIFMVELVFILVCCAPVIAPWMQPRGVLVNDDPFPNTLVDPE